MRKKTVEALLKANEAKARETMKRVYAKGYSDAGASLTRRALKGFIPSSASPVDDIDANNLTLRQRGRMLYMASPIAAAAINTNRTKIVGAGLHMRASVNHRTLGLSPEAARDWQRRTEAEFELWANDPANCDMLGLSSFYDLQQLAVKSWLMSGDVFALLRRVTSTPDAPYTLRLQLVEADRVSTPSNYAAAGMVGTTEGRAANGNLIHDGVEIDGDGRVVAYHICNAYPSAYAVNREWVRVSARGELTGMPNVLHVMDAERPDQYRGVTYLAQSIEPLLQMRRYTESELMAALIQSYFTAWVKTSTDPTSFPFGEVGAGDVDGVPGDQPENISRSDAEYEMGPGQVNHLQEGEDIVFGNPNIPTAGFEAFVKSIEKMIGAGLEMPYDVLMKEFNSSYSAAKGALEEAWETVKMRRAWFIGDFCKPVYETWLADAVASGRVIAPGFFDNPLIRAAWSGARWDGPAQTHLDPLKEAKANELLTRHAWKTNEQVTREYYDGNWAENAEAVKEEAKVYGLDRPRREVGTEDNFEDGEDEE